MRLHVLVFTMMALLFAGCATPLQRFERVKVGMEKDQVLRIMESPQRTERIKDSDRWTYIFYNDDRRLEKEVDFSQGLTTYAGDHQPPAVSAEEQDRLNEESNKALEQQIAAKHVENQNNYQKYEDDSAGTNEIRYVPQFAPVQ